jgi:DNA topoisomerase-3
MRVVLAEKPSVARELAAFLGASSRHKGYFEGKGYQVTWALGHLAVLKEPEDYDPALKRWSLATLPFVPDRFELKLRDEKGAREQFAIIKRLFRAADEVICATDAGREGELIFRYILELTGATAKSARRLWLNSLTEDAIRDAFRRLRPLADYDALYAAARCRSQADWVVGLNATRYYTVRHRDAGGRLWSVGRVQTPVLALIVRRDDEIRAFKPEPFWELLTLYREVTFKFTGDRFAKEEAARALLDRVQGNPFLVRAVEKKEERELPPQLHDLTELQREMNRRHGLSADATLQAAQALYEAKLVTYPRTDSRYLTSDMKTQLPGILEELRPLKPAEIGRLDLQDLPFTSRIVNDAKVGDHHAIIPTGKRPGELPPAQQKVHGAVVTRLIAAFYPVCGKEVTTVAGESNGVPFRARGVRILDPGWTVLYPARDEKKADEQELPEFRPGESGPHEPFLKKGETTPPKPYTESALLGAMETAGKLVTDEALKEALKERGLGTPATRAAIIETLLARGYVTRDQKALVATDAGRYLVALVRDRGLKSAELTGEWEAKLREIERGRLDAGQFLAEIVRYTGRIIRSSEEAAVDEGRLGECPRCGRAVIEGKRGFGCSGWREGCPFVLWKEYRGRLLELAQVRDLLQHRVLLRPIVVEGADPVILQLTDAGAVLEIPVPQGEPRRPAGGSKAEQASRRKGGKAPRPAPAAGETPGRTRNGSPAGSGAGSGKPAARKAEGTLGPCPLCGSDVVEQERSYGCSGWRAGCKFTIWKTTAGKKLSSRTARTLLRKGRTPLLKGFTSKAGKRFDARLKLENGAVRFDFEP